MTTPGKPLPRFKWPVAVRRTIAAPTQKIWEVISSPGMLPLYHPFCEKNPVFEWSGADSHDEIHYFNGLVLTRRFKDWYDDIGYDLEIGRVDGRQSVVAWRIESGKRNRSSLEIAIYPHALQKIPTVARWIPHLIRLRPQLKDYLRSVLMGLDWFITQGQPVRRNQFGVHGWFSPAVPVKDPGEA